MPTNNSPTRRWVATSRFPYKFLKSQCPRLPARQQQTRKAHGISIATMIKSCENVATSGFKIARNDDDYRLRPNVLLGRSPYVRSEKCRMTMAEVVDPCFSNVFINFRITSTHERTYNFQWYIVVQLSIKLQYCDRWEII